MFTNGILLHRASGRPPDLLTTGAASFKRWLGCAPQVIARVLPFRGAQGALTAAGTVMPSGPTLGTHQPHRPPHTTGLSVDRAFGWKRTAPTDAGLDDGADHVGVHKRICLCWDAQPNESRLSCGALKKNSFHNLRAPSASSAC